MWSHRNKITLGIILAIAIATSAFVIPTAIGSPQAQGYCKNGLQAGNCNSTTLPTTDFVSTGTTAKSSFSPTNLTTSIGSLGIGTTTSSSSYSSTSTTFAGSKTTTTSITTTFTSSTRSSSSSATTGAASGKQSLVYLAGVNYSQAVTDYAGRQGVTALGPQVYALEQNGSLFLSDTSFNPSQFTSLAHANGLQVIPLVMAGGALCSGGNAWCNNTGILAIINNSSGQLTNFDNQLVNLCQTYGFDGVQLDWETTLSAIYSSEMTTALNSMAMALHSMSPRRSLSVTTYASDFTSGPYNTWALSQGPIDQLNIQDYTGSLTNFETDVNSMVSGMSNTSKLAVGVGDYSGVNPPIAGQCVQYLLQKNIQSIAVWPEWGTEVSIGGYGYSDTVYQTTNYYELFAYFLSH